MSKVKFEIKSRWTGSILFEYEKENNTLKDTVVQAVKEEANLEGAYLEGAYLEGANLEGAYLEGAYIYISDNEIDITKIIKEFEERNNVKITEWYINKNIIPTRWSCFWNYGLIICNYEIARQIKKLTIAEVEKELSEKYNCEVKIGENL